MYIYFKSYKDYFWEWDKDSQDTQDQPSYIVTIPNGQSIAYLNLIIEDLEAIAPQGIPPFGTVLLTFIAISSTIQDSTFYTLKNKFTSEYGSQNKTITNAFKVLEHLRNLSTDFKTGVTRTQLLQTLFKNCHNKCSIQRSNEIVTNAKKGIDHYIINQQKLKVTDALINQDLRPIALLIRRFKSTEDIINAVNKVPRSEHLTETIEIEDYLATEINTEKTFLEQLSDNKKTYQIGSLVKRIWSGLNIPMHSDLPSNQPLGGVSDITNKGNFSQLLISEYAHDDDTFMSRIANNEALYIERETPPETDHKKRVFLIDSSLKNWGTPKVLSFAVSIAIATHPKSNFTYNTYVLGEDYTEAPTQSIIETIESLHLLSGTLHCAKGLQKFIDNTIHDTSCELFFLTEESSLNNSNIQHVLSNNREAINYIITNNLNGDINFYKHQNKSRKHFQHILLPYRDIWDSQQPKTKKLAPLKNNDLQIEHLLLEPIDRSNAKVIPFENEIYIIQNYNVYSLTSKGVYKGLQLRYEGLSFYKDSQFTIIKNEQQDPILITFSQMEKTSERLNLKTKEHSVKAISKDFFKHKTLLLYAFKTEVIITNKTDYWALADDSKLHLLQRGATYQDSLLNYQESISNFRTQLKLNKTNYNLLKNIDQIIIKHDDTDVFALQISNYILETKRLLPLEKSTLNYQSYTYNHSKKISPIASVYLKRTNGNNITIVKHINKKLNIPLKESKAIVDSTPTLLVKDYTLKAAEQLKKEIEELGGTCYFKINYFRTNDGSTIHIKNGQFIFTSSLASLPQFYITALLNFDLAMATDGEFAGNPYFTPVKNKLTTISLDNFYSKYINPFMKHIIDYEA